MNAIAAIVVGTAGALLMTGGVAKLVDRDGFEGPWQEIRVTGEIGTLTVDLIYGTVAAVTRFDRYPPPEGHVRWDADESVEWRDAP